VRNATLHGLLEAFTTDAAARLTLATAQGDEMPFEVVQTDAASRVPLYCYRPLTGAFIRERLGVLVGLSSYAPVARALEAAEGTEAYLHARGESRISERPRERADAALRCFLNRLFEERSDFGFDTKRFALAYDELERALYQGQCVVEVVASLLGLELDPITDELVLGDGLSVMRRGALAGPPDELLPSTGESEGLLLVLRVTQARAERAPVSMARSRFRRVLTALRLFERGGYAIGPIAWSRIDSGAWRPVALGTSGRPGLPTRVPAEQEDEFRAFCHLVGRRLPAPGRPGTDASGAGEVAWALARFELACERIAPFEALTDYLLALRALLEPEGPSSGRLAQRLAVICARPENRAALAERTARVISLERAVIAGLAPGDTDPAYPVDRLVDELAEHLRAVLRDVLCGHLDADVRGVADELLAEAAGAVV
jgi:hypothetical protein